MKKHIEITDIVSLDDKRTLQLGKLSSSLISDVMNKSGIGGQIISGISPLKKGTKTCGKAFTATYTDNNDPAPGLFENNRYLLDEIPANQSVVLLIENRGKPCLASSWGFLVSLYAMRKGISGTITNGYARDCSEIRDLRYPVFCTGSHYRNSNQSYKVISLQNQIQLHGVPVNPGDFILADDSGIAVIPHSIIDHILMQAAQKQKDETKIAELMNNGLTLREIDEAMKGTQKYFPSKNSLFHKETSNENTHKPDEHTESQIFIKSCL